jgi:hypothetical protein
MQLRTVLPTALALGLMAAAAPAMATGPHVTATPHTRLVNGQSIKVAVVAFPAHTAVTIAQCTGPIPTRDVALAKCDLDTTEVVTTNASGAAHTTFTVRTGRIAQQGRCGAVSKNCILLAVAQTAVTQRSVPLRFGR